MKKILSIIITITVLFSSYSFVFANESSSSYKIDFNQYGLSSKSIRFLEKHGVDFGIKLNMSLPKALEKTDFSSEDSVLVNGKSYITKGCPFLYEDTTYFPIRDLSEIFGFDVSFNEAGKTVILSTNDKCIVLMPEVNINADETKSLVKVGNEITIEDSYYLMVNNRSYIPLRFVSELLGFSVSYETDGKEIRISGNKLLNGSSSLSFSKEQQQIINAMENYERTRELNVSGTINFTGQTKHVKANIKKEISFNKAVKIMLVEDQDGKKYKISREKSLNSMCFIEVNQLLPNGIKKQIDLFTYAGSYPYEGIDRLKLSGIYKYKNMDISVQSELSATITYKVNLPNEEATLYVTIQKNTGKLIKYQEEVNGKITKELIIN